MYNELNVRLPHVGLVMDPNSAIEIENYKELSRTYCKFSRHESVKKWKHSALTRYVEYMLFS